MQALCVSHRFVQMKHGSDFGPKERHFAGHNSVYKAAFSRKLPHLPLAMKQLPLQLQDKGAEACQVNSDACRRLTLTDKYAMKQ